MLGVWPGASAAWIEFARDARVQDAKKEETPWEEESRLIRLYQEAADFLLRNSGPERELAFLAEIEQELEKATHTALHTSLETLILTRPEILAPAGESHL